MSDQVSYLFAKSYADFVQRLRVPSGFLLLGAFALLARPNSRSLRNGIPAALLGLVLRAWASGHLAKNERLTTSGPYAWTRNPLYIGTLISAFGMVIGSRSRALAIMFGSAFLLVYLPAVELEEQHLRQLFPAYQSYAARVPRFLPKPPPGHVKQGFSPALYRRNREGKAALGLACALAWLVLRSGR